MSGKKQDSSVTSGQGKKQMSSPALGKKLEPSGAAVKKPDVSATLGKKQDSGATSGKKQEWGSGGTSSERKHESRAPSGKNSNVSLGKKHNMRPEPVSRTRTSSSGGDRDKDCCIVCYRRHEETKYQSIGVCDHRVCFECSSRMRVLLGQNECPSCRQALDNVSVTWGQELICIYLYPILGTTWNFTVCILLFSRLSSLTKSGLTRNCRASWRCTH